MNRVLVVDDVTVAYRSTVVLDGIRLELDAGASTAVTGRTGSGKSTLLSMICELVRPTRGTVELFGRDLGRFSRRQLAGYRRQHLGVVFQHGELLPALTAVENVALPAMLDGASWAQASARAVTLLDQLEVSSREIPALSLSGGERQRVAIARAVVNDPELLVADEPTGALDAATRTTVAELLFSVPARTGCALLVVTHDADLAARAEAHFVLYAGALVPAETVS